MRRKRKRRGRGVKGCVVGGEVQGMKRIYNKLFFAPASNQSSRLTSTGQDRTRQDKTGATIR